MQKEVLLGTLLGDAYIQLFSKVAKNGNRYYSFNWHQSIKEYALWKAELSEAKYSIKTYTYFDKRTEKTYTTYQCHLTLEPKLKEYYYKLFYSDKKRVSTEILNLLSDLSVCIWYLDDGNMYYNGNNCHITLSINGFDYEERELIRLWFNNKYNLNFKHNQKAIRITSKKECEKFMTIVEKYIPVCMEYKKLSIAISKYESKLSSQKLIYRNGQINKQICAG